MANELEANINRLWSRLDELGAASTGEGTPAGGDASQEFFVGLLAVGLFPLCSEWAAVAVSVALGNVADHVIRERRPDFLYANDELYTILGAMTDHGLALWHGDTGASPARILTLLGNFREAALLAAASLVSPQAASKPEFLRRLPFNWIKTRKFKELNETEQTTLKDLHALHYHGIYTRMASKAVALHLRLSRLLEPEEKEIGQVARVKRYRKRKRRRVAAVVPLEIFEDDLELLERFGYLVTAQTEAGQNAASLRTDAISDAVQAFLLQGFLTHVEEPSYPWAERIKRQRWRIKVLTERATTDDAQ